MGKYGHTWWLLLHNLLISLLLPGVWNCIDIAGIYVKGKVFGKVLVSGSRVMNT